MFKPIFWCIGGELDPSFTISMLIRTSSKRYAQSRLQNSFAFSLDFNSEDSRFEIAADDMSDMGSAFTSHNKAFKEELWMF